MAEEITTLEDKARIYAFQCHAHTNHKYDGKPYSVHLDMVHNYGLKYIDIIGFGFRSDVKAALWCHDVIEDTRQTYNNVVHVIGYGPADIVYALTNEKGKTRSERANDKYYQGLNDTWGASFVKICDRLANVSYSKQNGSSMFDTYEDEHEFFKSKLYQKSFVKMFMELDHLIYD